VAQDVEFVEHDRATAWIVVVRHRRPTTKAKRLV
jgi:hypothetical protein